MSTRRRVAGALAAGLLAVSLAACTQADTPRALTTEESQTLAAMRFKNFDAGVRAVSFEVTDRGAEFDFDGWYDFAEHRGYGLLDAGDGAALLAWTGDTVGVSAYESGPAPLPMPTDADWSTSALAPASSRLHTVLAIVSGLGADRPDNPLLLQQSGAMWIDDATADGIALTVFAGPPSDEPLTAGAELDPDASGTRYWLGAGGILHRADVRVGRAWVRLDFDAADGVDLGVTP